MNLSGKVVLITGGRRVGGQLARLLAARGASIAMTYHSSRDAIEQTLDEVRAQGTRGLAIAADLTDANQAEHTVEETTKQLGRLDALVSMASVFRRTPFDTLVPAHFDTMIAANLAAPYHTALACARRMRQQPAENGVQGKIVFIGDWATERPYADYLPYLVGKGGLKTLTMALARELAPGIAVNLVQPAMIDPPPDMTDDEKAAVIAQTPLARVGSSDDLNNLILYLLEGTDFATGATYRVDGGRFLGT
jgi:pteridine reductase